MYLWEMAEVFQNRLKYVRNDVDLGEMVQIYGKIPQLCDKRLKNMENDLEIWEMAKIFGKWLRYMGHGFSI